MQPGYWSAEVLTLGYALQVPGIQDVLGLTNVHVTDSLDFPFAGGRDGIKLGTEPEGLTSANPTPMTRDLRNARLFNLCSSCLAAEP